MDSVKDKNIWIIGASSGIGEALARNIAYHGGHVILSARSEDKLKAIAELLSGHHHVKPFDVTDLKKFQKTADDIVENIGNIDSCILMAGTYDPKLLSNMDIEKAHNIVDVNMKGALNCIHILLPILKKNRGQLALTASVAGYRGLPKGQPYSATKAAMINLVESLRTEEPDIDVRLISPGFVKTPMTEMNEFEMPMVIETDEAAEAIYKGLLSKSYEIHFPKKFTFIMKTIRILPHFLYFIIAKKMMAEINKREK